MDPKKENSPTPVAIISGASSGIGASLADLLVKRGYRVYGLARSFKAKLPKEESDAPGLYSLPLDVSDAAATETVMATILKREKRLDLLILAAGYGLAGPVEVTLPAEASRQMTTNLIGASTLLYAALPQMRRQNSGQIVFISSVAGFLPIPFQAYYSASKAAMNALALALRDEVSPWGLQVTLIQPGDTRTDFTRARVWARQASDAIDYQKRMQRSLQRMENDEQNGMRPEKMAALILRRIQRKNPPLVYTPGTLYRLAAFLNRVLPLRLVRYIISCLYAR